MRSLLPTLLFLLALPIAQAQETIIDNGGAQFSVVGDWPVSTAIAGFEGNNYRTHAANGAPANAIVVDNGSAGFSVVGDWPTSTAVGGFLGSNYQTHVANGDAPGSIVVDNTDSNITAVGTWPGSTSVAGYQGANYFTHAAGTGTASFSWVPAITQSGSYQVYAKWTAHANRASNATYTITHASGSTPVTVNQQANGGQWNLLGTYTMASGNTISITDQANGYVIADAIKLVPVDAPAAVNAANWNATLTTSGDYEVYARWTSHTNRASNAAYTVTHANGSTITIANQKANGGQWNLLGTYAFQAGNASVKLTDQADGYVIADAIMFLPVGAVPNSAIWTPTLTQTGDYQVYAKWTAYANRATDAKYTITHQGGQQTITVNQQANGGQWNLLGNYTLAPGASIRLTDQANGYVIADAIKLVTSNQAPTVSLAAPVNNTSYTTPATIQLTANATDADGSITQVAFYDGTTLLGNATQQGIAPDITYVLNWDKVAVGSYTLTAVATDNNNGTTVSAPVQVTVTAGAAQVYYIHTDQLDTPRLITDANNTPVWRWDNTDPFANNPVNDDPNNTGNHFTFNQRFPGQYYDVETNTHYNYFRDYDPQSGRYIESDPIGLAGGVNTYGYANQNPLTFTDPSGENAVIAGACVLVVTSVYFVYKYNKFVKCVEQCSTCPKNPTGDTGLSCNLPKVEGDTRANSSCRTYCTLDAFAGPRGKGAAGSNDYP